MKSAILSSDPIVAEQATELLKTGAIEAVVGAAIVAAARDASVFFGPLQILVGGSGTGLFAIDGRVRQPGLGVVRPRGFKEEDEIPPAAYVGVPAFAGAVFAALALTGKDVTLSVFSPGIGAAKAHSTARSELLNRIARKGAGALADGEIAGELVAAAGRVAGGLLTQEDLASTRPDVGRCQIIEEGKRRIAIAPWNAPESRTAATTNVHVIVAADARGQVAAACYETSSDAIALGAFDLAAPRCASPVLRGQERARPGDPIAAFAPLAITHVASVWESVIAVAKAIHGSEVASAFGSDSEIEAGLRALGRGVGILKAEDRVQAIQGS